MSLPVESADGDRLSFVSGGREIEVVAYRSATPNTASIVVLHGAGGVDAGNRYVSLLAQWVAENGFNTFLVEYFDRTGTVYASDAVIRAKFGDWLETIGDAVTFIAKQPNVDPARIGSFGYSLGGYLAVAHASQDDRIKATVELAGGIDPEFAKTVKRLPPVLIVHGREDQRVPFARAIELQEFAGKLGTQVEVEFLPNERHILSPRGAMSALGRALSFLRAHLE